MCFFSLDGIASEDEMNEYRFNNIETVVILLHWMMQKIIEDYNIIAYI